MLNISKKTEYSLLLISLLLDEKDFAPLTKLVEHTELPLRFLARISAILANNNVLLSREGRVGGYKLAERFYTMSLFDFLSIFEQNLNAVNCNKKGKKCKFEKICKHKNALQTKLNFVILRDLKQIQLKELFI